MMNHEALFLIELQVSSLFLLLLCGGCVVMGGTIRTELHIPTSDDDLSIHSFHRSHMVWLVW
jgi:hypothetical protein